MKYRVTYTAGAKKDLKNIFRYISERLLAPQNAAGQTERIMAAIQAWILCQNEIGFMKKNRGTAEDFDFSRSIIIWCFIRWMKKLKWYM